MTIKTISDCYDYIYSFINLENNLDNRIIKNEYNLNNIRELLNIFDNPQKNFKIIHIAGTKGKGSVVYFISQLLSLSGYNTTAFISPHILNPNERILFNLIPISDAELIEIVNHISEKILNFEIKPTTFELFFLIFLLYSKKKNPDFLVIETGLGGRLDTTNIIDSMISVITTIGFDHTNILGKRIVDIAREKGGIIKENRNVVISKQIYNCQNVFKRIASDRNTKIFFTDKLLKLKKIQYKETGFLIDLKFKNIWYKNIMLDFFGKHQINNFLCALYTVYLINKNIIELLSDDKNKFYLPKARIELINKNPEIILDVSHNKESVIQLIDSIKKHFNKKKWIIISCMAIDKDYKTFYKKLNKITDYFIITKLSQYKKSEPNRIFDFVKRINKKSYLIENTKDAIDETIFLAIKKQKNILVTGSFYLAGPFLERWNEYNKINR